MEQQNNGRKIHLPDATPILFKRKTASWSINLPQIGWCSQEHPKSALSVPKMATMAQEELVVIVANFFLETRSDLRPIRRESWKSSHPNFSKIPRLPFCTFLLTGVRWV